MEVLVSLAPKLEEILLAPKFGVVEEVEVRYDLVACFHYL